MSVMAWRQEVFAAALAAAVAVSGCRGMRHARSDDAEAALESPPAEAAAPAAESAPAAKPAVEPAAGADVSQGAFRIKRGDTVSIMLMGIPEAQNQHVDIVDENGEIRLPYVDRLKAADLTTSELEARIREAYVMGGIYRNISVTVNVPERGIYVSGEVLHPGRLPLIPGTTVLKAVAAAGGFSEFANRRSVKLIRGNETIVVNCKRAEKDPSLDPPLLPDDQVKVERSVF